jgi:hypothetical protein
MFFFAHKASPSRFAVFTETPQYAAKSDALLCLPAASCSRNQWRSFPISRVGCQVSKDKNNYSQYSFAPNENQTYLLIF